MFSQSPGFIFHNIGERDGLSANYCHRILKDSRGFLWIGTVNGLSRFDGSHFYNFKSGKDSTSFVNNEIIDLCEDREGNIWGATASGIFSYQVKKNIFKNYIPPTLDFARRIPNIICDTRGDIWATSEWNILKLNKQKNNFEEIGPLTRDRDSLSFYSVRPNGLVEDPSGKGLWFATRRGLHYYDVMERKFFSYKNTPGDSLFTNHSVAGISLAPGGYFWFFDNVTKKIIAFDPASHKILRQVDISSALPNSFGHTIFEDSQNRLWFSTWNNKMAVIDYRNKSITPIAFKINDPLSIAGDNIGDAWEDKDKNIWLATSGGISKCNYSKNVYSIIPIVENVKEFKNGQLGAFTIDPRDKSWWIASEGTVAVIQYFPGSGQYEYYDFSRSVKNSNGQLPGPVFKFGFIDGQPYAMTHTGVWRLDKKTKQVIPFEKKFEDWPYIPFIYFDINGDEVWFSTKEGHIKWNRLTNRAIKIKAAVDSLPDGQQVHYGAVFFDRTGRAWTVPAFGWLGYINAKSELVLKYYIKNKAKELSGYLTSMTDDKHGNLWMAGSGIGLYKYDIDKEEMKLYDQADGITRFVRQAMEDKEGRLWLMAMNKFSVFNPGANSISHYSLPLYENTQDYGNILLADSSGAMLATVYKDIIKFMPERLNLRPVIKVPTVSMIKISGKEKLITDETKLLLEPNENSLEFNFGSLISNEIFPYSFEYRLEGFDKEWITANASATALYNNLDPGKYIFKVRALAKDKSWQTPERIITLTIRTPFYKAWWFWLMMALVFIGTLMLLYRFRLNKQKEIFTLQAKAQELEKEKTMVMYESLKQQLNPHFLFNSLTSLSGLIETDQQVAGNFLEQMSGIYRYILKNGNSETVFLKDEIEFVQLYIDLQQTRFNKGLVVNINVPEEFLHYKIAPVTLQNLIENAIKHNVIDIASALVIEIFIAGDYLVVKNNLQRKNVVETSNGKGLAQFTSLYHYLSELPVIIEETEKTFIIKIPLI
jgi:ligand-binding sensor domain-containing protein